MSTSNRCWLCGGGASQILEVTKPIYYHCPTCDLIFIDRNFLISAEDEKARYQLHNNTMENEGYVKFLSRFIDNALQPLNINFQTGLDFGCGPAPVLSSLLSQRGIDMDWYDPFFYPDKNFVNKKYDLITATEVLEHLQQPKTVMDLLTYHLNPQGILAVMTQFHSQHNFKNWWYRQDNTHICFYSAKTFNWMAKHYHLKILLLDNKSICVMQSE
ncbi:class I SAM-dependent methyltransferase [Peptococcaceae bacterium 1198_IL3148]